MRKLIECVVVVVMLLFLIGCGGEGGPEGVEESDVLNSEGQLPSTYATSDSFEGGVPGVGGEIDQNPDFESSGDAGIDEEWDSDEEPEPSVDEDSDSTSGDSPGDCYPECFAKQCGDDGCGGSCGTCPSGTFCDDQNLCNSDPTCTPNCDGKECGGDGCGGLCGTCIGNTSCVDGNCVDPPPNCTPSCVGKVCGNDGCGGTCGDCPAGSTCQTGQCVNSCTPNCAGKECGDDGCGGTCGSCGGSSECSSGQCVCQPNCMGKFCGDNGCGGSCGDCSEPLSCVSGQCICEPDCTGKTCGDDGCGGSCGVCGCDDQKVFVRAANFGAPSELQVFFITEADDTWNEPKSKTVTIDTDGQYETLELPVGDKATWTGTITGLRIDPMKNDEPFGIDSVCVGVTEDACLLQWTFDGATEVVSPFFGWEIHAIEGLWTDGDSWGGQASPIPFMGGTKVDPWFRTILEFECEP